MLGLMLVLVLVPVRLLLLLLRRRRAGPLSLPKPCGGRIWGEPWSLQILLVWILSFLISSHAAADVFRDSKMIVILLRQVLIAVLRPKASC